MFGRAASRRARAGRDLERGVRPPRLVRRDARRDARGGRARSLGDPHPARRVTRLPPALAAAATPRILELLGEPPARVLELGFAGIHAEPLRLAGFEVVVVEPDPAHRARALERAGAVLDRVPAERFDAVVAPEDVAVPAAAVVIRVGQDGSVWRSTST